MYESQIFKGLADPYNQVHAIVCTENKFILYITWNESVRYSSL